MIFNESHRDFFDSLKELYEDKKETFIRLQDHDVRKGNDQTPVNYWLQINKIEMKLDLPMSYNLRHMNRKEMFNYVSGNIIYCRVFPFRRHIFVNQ